MSFQHNYLYSALNDDIQRMSLNLNNLEDGKLKKLMLKKIKITQSIVSKFLELKMVCEEIQKEKKPKDNDDWFN
jgi:hypothetical protein